MDGVIDWLMAVSIDDSLKNPAGRPLSTSAVNMPPWAAPFKPLKDEKTVGSLGTVRAKETISDLRSIDHGEEVDLQKLMKLLVDAQ